MTRLHETLDGWVDGWRSGTRRSQVNVLAVLVVCDLVSTAVSFHDYAAFPLAAFFVWLLLGRLMLRFWPLAALVAVIVVTGAMARAHAHTSYSRVPALVALVVCSLLVLYAASRQRTGLPGPLSEAMLADLRARLSAQGTVPPLPGGWLTQTAMRAAFGVGYAGDFMVADLDEEAQVLDLVLVDVVGKGVKAAPTALLLAGAMGGLVGSARGSALLEGANNFLLRQHSDETFATAVHVSVHLSDGHFTILSAGHPPALRWRGTSQEWVVDGSRGLALGIAPHPELHASEGILAPGDALLFYTDGVVESPDTDIEDGIDWLRRTARDAVVSRGFDGAVRRIIRKVPRGDDDRALLILARPGR